MLFKHEISRMYVREKQGHVAYIRQTQFLDVGKQLLIFKVLIKPLLIRREFFMRPRHVLLENPVICGVRWTTANGWIM